MKQRELKRQGLHIFTGIVIVSMLHSNVIDVTILAIFTVLSLLFSIISLKFKVPLVNISLEHMGREDEKKFPGKGFFYYLVGSTLAVALFDKNIAMASILVLALGDSFSRYVGQFHGKIKHPFSDTKLVEGWAAGIGAATIGALAFVPWYAALIASIVAMTLESLELKMIHYTIDDNLVIPVVAGLIMTLAL